MNEFVPRYLVLGAVELCISGFALIVGSVLGAVAFALFAGISFGCGLHSHFVDGPL